MSVGAVNKQTGDRIPTAGMPAIDDALDLTSVNPVQNAIITAALANKQDKTDNNLETTAKNIVGAINEHEGDIDSLKSGLTNYEATTNAALALPTNSGKNVFPVTLALLKDRNTDGTWSGNNYTISGVTFACAFNSDGYLTSITANGTSTAYIYFQFYQRTINPLHLDGSFIVSGGLNNNAIFVVGRTYNGAWQVLGASKGGDSNPFTVALSDDIGANIEADNGTEFTNAMFYPMIRPSTITDPTFAPYIPSVDARLDAVESGVAGLTNKIKDTSFNVTCNECFSVEIQGSHYITDKVVHINCLVKALSVPDETDISIAILPSGMTTAIKQSSMTFPIFKANGRWGSLSSIVYGYVSTNALTTKKSEVVVDHYYYIDYIAHIT